MGVRSRFEENVCSTWKVGKRLTIFNWIHTNETWNTCGSGSVSVRENTFEKSFIFHFKSGVSLKMLSGTRVNKLEHGLNETVCLARWHSANIFNQPYIRKWACRFRWNLIYCVVLEIKDTAATTTRGSGPRKLFRFDFYSYHRAAGNQSSRHLKTDADGVNKMFRGHIPDKLGFSTGGCSTRQTAAVNV